jgi:hypothetical protein
MKEKTIGLTGRIHNEVVNAVLNKFHRWAEWVGDEKK